MVHALGPVDNKPYVLTSIGIELALVALGQKLGKSGDRVQWLFQIMGSHVSESFQFGIRRSQLCRALFQRLLGPEGSQQFFR
jgi:hypothetical protein